MHCEKVFTIVKGVVVVWCCDGDIGDGWHILFGCDKLYVRRAENRRVLREVINALQERGFSYCAPDEFLDIVGRALLVGRVVARADELQGIGAKVMKLIKRREA
ncbi:MAG: hypothetical protein QXT00_02290 [Ignisphaera sp.]